MLLLDVRLAVSYNGLRVIIFTMADLKCYA